MTGYELGARSRFPSMTGAILWKNTKSIEGVIAFARCNRTGEYVRVYEVAADEFVQGEAQSWSSGNFETVESAKAAASKAYRWLNRS